MAIQKLKGMPEASSTQYKIPQKRGSTQVAEARAQAQRVKLDHRDLVHDQVSHALLRDDAPHSSCMRRVRWEHCQENDDPDVSHVEYGNVSFQVYLHIFIKADMQVRLSFLKPPVTTLFLLPSGNR